MKEAIMITMVDHVVILVHDLAQAITNYEALGFTVVPGGEHTDGSTHNALIGFDDGTYLELLAFKRENEQHRWWRHVATGEGLIDFAVLPSDPDSDVAAARERGLEMVGPFAGGRNRLDGVRLEWKTAFATAEETPFFCGDVTPRELRVPGGEAVKHANGVVGIAEVVVAVQDAPLSAARYAALLGVEPVLAGSFARFTLGSGAIELRGSDDPQVAEQLAKRGEGIVALHLRAHADSGQTLDGQLTHGAHIRVL
jgi:catechol 2,3-dioxygenase-like lactoylglutathione lyase family enzyme